MLMQLSSEAGRLQERTRVLAEEVALLKAAMEPKTSRHGAEPKQHPAPKTVESVQVS
jgi:hypothetical protein